MCAGLQQENLNEENPWQTLPYLGEWY